MADIHIHRHHTLGLARAREVARQWVVDAGRRYDMACTVAEGADHDTVNFRRSGVSGQLVVTADAFELTAKLGFLLGGFKAKIEAEIGRNLDRLLGA